MIRDNSAGCRGVPLLIPNAAAGMLRPPGSLNLMTTTQHLFADHSRVLWHPKNWQMFLATVKGLDHQHRDALKQAP